eukprot:6930219-Lingulodinium_polyedra.AAC.1
MEDELRPVVGNVRGQLRGPLAQEQRKISSIGGNKTVGKPKSTAETTQFLWVTIHSSQLEPARLTKD